jgi:hypothetical protein
MVSETIGNTHTANYVNSGLREARRKKEKRKKEDTPLFNSMQEAIIDKMIFSHLFGRKVLRNATPTPQKH